jgi:hypothetical protein
MSIISGLFSTFGVDNVNAFVAIVLVFLVVKTFWDVYKSKEIVKHSELKIHVSSYLLVVEELRTSIIDLKKSIDESKQDLGASKEKMDKLDGKLSNRLKNLEDKAKLADEKLVALLDGIVVTPKISRAEARRLKESKES